MEWMDETTIRARGVLYTCFADFTGKEVIAPLLLACSLILGVSKTLS